MQSGVGAGTIDVTVSSVPSSYLLLSCAAALLTGTGLPVPPGLWAGAGPSPSTLQDSLHRSAPCSALCILGILLRPTVSGYGFFGAPLLSMGPMGSPISLIMDERLSDHYYISLS